ncbi:MAG: carbohydrate ABC transporter permease [Ruminiclostridium sp.]
MIKKEKLKDRIGFIILLIAAIITLFPFFWMLSTALKPSGELFAKVPILFPSDPQWSNFSDIFKLAPFERYFLNSGIVATTSVLLTVFINLLAGYTFAKYKFKGRNVMFMLVLSTLMIPMQIIMVPNFIILSKLGWLNSYAGLIIPRAAEAFGLFLSKQFMDDIPIELIEAARIDGEGEFKIFINIILPNCKPLIAILSIFTFMWRWNDFLWPLIITSSKDMYTVQLGLASFVGQFYVEWNSLMAISLLAVIPVLIVFLLFQKLIVQGIATTGIKG